VDSVSNNLCRERRDFERTAPIGKVEPRPLLQRNCVRGTLSNSVYGDSNGVTLTGFVRVCGEEILKQYGLYNGANTGAVWSGSAQVEEQEASGQLTRYRDNR